MVCSWSAAAVFLATSDRARHQSLWVCRTSSSGTSTSVDHRSGLPTTLRYARRFSTLPRAGFLSYWLPGLQVWNSRVAMMSFVWVYLQEVFFGPILKA